MVPCPPTLRAIPLAGVAVSLFGIGGTVAHATPVCAQEAVVRVEENFRSEPNGAILGQLAQGTRVSVEERDGNWARATIQGFIWTPSVQDRQTTGPHGLVISVADGENLRDVPAGRIAGRLLTGTVLEELERIPGWVEVRRTGWIWNASLDAAQPTVAASPAVGTRPPVANAAPLGGEWLRGGSQGAAILSAPDGDTLGQAHPGSELRIVSQQGNWARIQLEGWVWVPSVESGTEPQGGEATILSDVRAGDLSREYDRFRGRLVEMRLQYISLERAEQVRTDFREGEPFLLTRSLDEDRSFVYVAVPPEHLDDVGTLTPLESIRVLARVRAGAAAFTGSPILDLIEFERIR
jgi:hypothetical protein